MALVNKIKTLSSVGILAATLFLAGCQAQSNILAFTPPAPSASMNVNRTAVVSVTTKIAVQYKRLRVIRNTGN